MALYTIGDLHLCLGAPKPMDVFGGKWVGYMEKLERGGTYSLNPEQKRLLSEGMYAAVNSNKRLSEVIPNAYRTFGHVLCPYSAMVYTGVMDYQSITGQYNKVLMLCDYSPRHSLEATSRAMGIDKHELKRRLNLT